MPSPRPSATCHTTILMCPLSPAARVAPLAVRDDFKQQTEEEYLWLEQAKWVLEDNTGTEDNTSWAAFHASRQPPWPLCGHDPALTGCRGASESWADASGHLRSASVCLGQANSVEVVGELRRRQVDGDVWWAPHRDGSLKDAEGLAAREWLGACTGAREWLGACTGASRDYLVDIISPTYQGAGFVPPTVTY